MISLFDPTRLKRILCIGAHSDDIEIGCGGTILRLIQECPGLHVHWAVLGGSKPQRAKEARDSAEQFLKGAGSKQITIGNFRDSYMPYEGVAVKDFFEAELKGAEPDLIFTHYRDDRHQDHRLVSDLTWNTWRSHFILEYEIPKYDGDLGRPNLYVNVDKNLFTKKIDLLMKSFPTQAGRHWFTEDTFAGLMRLRGIESGQNTPYAEAFHCGKIAL